MSVLSYGIATLCSCLIFEGTLDRCAQVQAGKPSARPGPAVIGRYSRFRTASASDIVTDSVDDAFAAVNFGTLKIKSVTFLIFSEPDALAFMSLKLNSAASKAVDASRTVCFAADALPVVPKKTLDAAWMTINVTLTVSNILLMVINATEAAFLDEVQALYCR